MSGVLAPARSRGVRRPAASTVAGVFGLGVALPEQVVTNADLEAVYDTSDAWIVRRTGIRERRRLAEGARLSDLAAEAARRALADAGRDGAEVDHVVVTTITPDLATPGLAPSVAAAIGAVRAGALDLNAACAGFLHGLDHAAALVESGRARCVVVVAAEAMSRLVGADRGPGVIFGDGAGAVVVAGGELDLGIGGVVAGADAAQEGVLFAPVGGQVVMDGPHVYRHAVDRMVQAAGQALGRCGLRAEDLDLLVAHQANVRIVDAAAAALGVPPERVVCNVDRVANTSSASIPLALADAEADGRLRPGMLVGLASFGAGFVWAAGVVRWKERALVCA